MNAKKLRRKLIGLCICLFIAWIITTFPLIVMWYAKGGLTSHGLTVADKAMVGHMFVFDIIPTYASGYLIFALCLLNFILKSKRSGDESSHDAS
jgi:hypothetical protein